MACQLLGELNRLPEWGRTHLPLFVKKNIYVNLRKAPHESVVATSRYQLACARYAAGAQAFQNGEIDRGFLYLKNGNGYADIAAIEFSVLEAHMNGPRD